ncbi:hypothetical protein [Streptomyces sp. NRRL F-5053]|uniref:hypothetical protein n=1 Tax=Streptomyces sp. NRRL F-5053 TaxID=1463854 RepID=UPI0006915B5E|nr:hypothetical protein [Streptomyces sp. NRRL F-5053]
MAVVNRPGIADAEFEVRTDEIFEQIIRRHPVHTRMRTIQRLPRTVGVTTRRFTRPLHEVAGEEGFQQRNDLTYTAVRDLGERAAHRALAEAGVTPGDIGTLITAHATGLAVPGLDVHLVQALGLPREVKRIPMTQLACVGGAHVLAMAAERADQSRRPVLAVLAEALSTSYQDSDDSIEAMIFKFLFGDGGAAVVVSPEPLAQPCVEIDAEQAWEYVLQDDDGGSTAHYYALRADEKGYHFDSQRAALRAPQRVLQLLPWSARNWEWTAIHPGSPGILDKIVDSGLCAEDAVRHSRATLAEDGNTGGGAVLRVLARMQDDPPTRGAHGLVLGFGPGFTAAACPARWVGRS